MIFWVPIQISEPNKRKFNTYTCFFFVFFDVHTFRWGLYRDYRHPGAKTNQPTTSTQSYLKSIPDLYNFSYYL